MLRPIAAVLVVLAFGATVGCGSGDKKPSASAPTIAATQPAKTAAASATESGAVQGSDAAIGNIFSSVLGSALGGGGGAAPGAAAANDPTLTRFLPEAADLPDGFTAFGQLTSRVPDGISQNGGMDMAASMAIGGSLASSDPADGSLLMSMVLKPDDLTSLGKVFDAFGNMDDETLKKSIEDSGGSFQGINITNVHTLDASGLGEGSAGISMTMDLGDYIAKLGAGAPIPAGFSVMTMHMYMFGRGDYIGAVVRIGFADELPADVDEVGLAKVIDQKLRAG